MKVRISRLLVNIAGVLRLKINVLAFSPHRLTASSHQSITNNNFIKTIGPNGPWIAHLRKKSEIKFPLAVQVKNSFEIILI